MFGFDLVEIVFIATIFIFSISVHEFTHALTSYILGDHTPKIQGKISLNPIKHLSFLGFLSVFFINFGRGKYTQTNYSFYKNPIKDQIIVASSGPFINFFIAIIAVLLIVTYSFFWLEITHPANINVEENSILLFLYLTAFINIILAALNILPIPPLDGFRLVKFFYPESSKIIEKYGIYLAFGLILLIFIPYTGNFIESTTAKIGDFIYGILFVIVSNIFY
ncbi:site-2 protease family protein [Candidatus Absconditicoccus praedator]|uniref:site-2 protease family protein n=1 Tax=Candidatus Absconditicoccus praedator TaxID=2735562 RepID=UPI001E4F4EB5|nr:site-2 protease family protein [Candidatus Absconditicoccus praedator]UFX83449.1 site-2 protease family protein [Candidatus Absconditicoccus praedator]